MYVHVLWDRLGVVVHVHVHLHEACVCTCTLDVHVHEVCVRTCMYMYSRYMVVHKETYETLLYIRSIIILYSYMM